MKKVLLCYLLLLVYGGFATHNRAGEILYKRVAPFTAVVNGALVQVYTYSFTIIKYTDHGPNIADRCEDTIHFGDGSTGIAPRVNGTSTCNCGTSLCGQVVINDPSFTVKVNVYTIVHTYPGPGTYKVWSLDPNRNSGVHNIPNSVNVPFYVESFLVINSFTGANSSPIFEYPPTDRACVGQCFYHNPGAYDIDGDSLSYELTMSRGENGSPVPGYFYPETGAGGTFEINALTGTLKWCVPQFQDEYNIAFIVKEWRKNTAGVYELVGYVLRDMQVIVIACPNNNPPNVAVPVDTCVEAGTMIIKKLIVTDPDNGQVNISGEGGGFASIAPNANISPTSGVVTYTSTFTWQTTCDHIRSQPYQHTFKVEDQQTVKLVNFATYNIKVVPPAVQNVSATPIGSNMKITWNAALCNPPSNPLLRYDIYRRADCTPLVFTPCKTGVDPASGYVKIGQVGPTVTSYTDTNNGNGLVVGQDYSYIVVAVYRDGSSSFGSSAICAKLKRDVPIILNVDILSTSASTGSVYVRWARPLKTTGNFDTLVYPGPYQFNLKHRSGSSGAYTTVFNSTKNFLYQLDTDYTHLNLNTINSDQQYIVEFIAGTVTIGSSQKATSVFLSATGADREIQLQWTASTPWNNYLYTVFRKNPGSSTFTAVATTSLTSYNDTTNVVNRATYCYKVLSEGQYSDPTIFKPLLNNSQEVCATAKDLSIPCVPSLSVIADCPLGSLRLEWNDVTKSCSDDVIKYVLFKKETIDADYVKLDTIYGSGNVVYTFDGLVLISSCFAIQAIDSSGNASPISQDYCIDNCPEFELPNIITLNGDNVNDFFKAIKVRQIKEIDLYVYDRWGNLVYKTKDPYFKWDGTSIITNKQVSDGTLFYICDVYEPRVSGIKKRNLKGYVQVVK